jgi:Uma2 family endonuclease
MATVAAPRLAPRSRFGVYTGSAPLHRFTVAEYHKMIRDGVLREGERIELIRGLILKKMPINPHHSKAVRRLNQLVPPLLAPDAWVVFSQQPTTFPDSEPEPDFCLATGPQVKYDDRHPIPEEVGLLVEVADSSLAYDQGDKLALYAEAKIPVYWIVNIPDRRVEVYTQPRGGKSPTYRKSEFYPAGQSVPVVLAGRTVGAIPVSELLP